MSVSLFLQTQPCTDACTEVRYDLQSASYIGRRRDGLQAKYDAQGCFVSMFGRCLRHYASLLPSPVLSDARFPEFPVRPSQSRRYGTVSMRFSFIPWPQDPLSVAQREYQFERVRDSV